MKQKLNINKMNVKEALLWANSELRSKEVREPESSALVLLGDVLGMNRTELLANPEKGLSLLEIKKFRKYIARRQKHESVWHIIGKVQFCGLDFIVNKDVLVPRPETELLVEQVIQHIKKLEIEKLNRNYKFQIKNSRILILDMGTGSGTIAIALAKELSLRLPERHARVGQGGAKGDKAISRDHHASLAMTNKIFATDISAKALGVAKRNAKKLKVEKYIKFIRCNLFPPTTNSQQVTAGKFDVITANLPYIPSEDMEGLAIDVYHYEPKLALDGGHGGLEIYERMLSQASEHLNPGGQIFCEIGINQGKEFKLLVKKYLPNSSVKIIGDLAGIDRVAIIKTNNN